MSEVLYGVMSVLVKRPQQLLQALLHPVGVRRGGRVKRVSEASHAQLLLLVDLGNHTLLVHGLERGRMCFGEENLKYINQIHL